MIKWLFYFPFSLLASVVCYITNPFVVLFANDDGELPGVFRYWQTWDNSCNPSEIMDILPSWLQYDWARHYREYVGTTDYLQSVNRERWFTECIDNNFTITEIIKRYIGRVVWLTRNNAYGWGFYVFGHTATPLILIQQSENTIYANELNGDGWMYKNTAPMLTVFGWTIYWNNLLGWKLNTEAIYDTRSMYAMRVSVFFEREAD